METPCVLWEGGVSAAGYGYLHARNKCLRAHREIYERAHGAIPEGVDIHHVCRNKLCVNLDHLEAVDHREHVRFHRREIVAGFCSRGHERNERNTRMQSYKNGAFAVCRVCDRERKRAQYRAAKSPA